jgi:hypothetical protein
MRRIRQLMLVGGLASVLFVGVQQANAKKAEEPQLRVTLEPSIGNAPRPEIRSAAEIEEHELYHGPEEREIGMTVATLAALEGVATNHITWLRVVGSASEKTGMSGPQALGEAPLPDGSRGESAFRVGGARIQFFWPPRDSEDLIGNRSVTGGINGTVAATFEIRGGLLGVGRPTFSPAAPEAGKVVTFAPPHAEYRKPISGLEYAWNFGDTSASNEPGPSHTFKPPAGAGVETFHVKVTVTAQAAEGEVSGVATVDVPVTRKESPPPEEQKGHIGKRKSELPSGPPKGSPTGPSIPVVPSQVYKTAGSAAETSGHGSGAGHGSGHGHGHGTGSGTGTGRGHSGANGAASLSGKGATAASAGASDTGTAAPPVAPPQQSARPPTHATVLAPGLVGVLLESSSAALPRSAESTLAASATTIAPLPDAGHGSGDGTDAGLLPWIVGILAVLALVLLGGLTEFQPLARRRRLSAP